VIVDLFAGPGGWDEGCRYIGVDDVLGVEWDDAACVTRYAAGHKTWQANIAAVTLDQITAVADTLDVRGLIGSPPCPAFSAAGKRLAQLLEHERSSTTKGTSMPTDHEQTIEVPEGALNIKITSEGIIIDATDSTGQVIGTEGRTFEELHDRLVQ